MLAEDGLERGVVVLHRVDLELGRPELGQETARAQVDGRGRAEDRDALAELQSDLETAGRTGGGAKGQAAMKRRGGG